MSSLGKTAALAASAEVDAVGERGERPVKNAADVRDSTIRRSLALSDVIAVLIALTAAIVVAGRPAQGSRLLWGLAAIPLMVLLFKLYGLYDRDVKRISHSTADDLPRLFHAAIVGTLILWLYSKLTPMHRLDLEEVVLFATLAIGLSTIGRFAVRTGVPHMLGPEPAILVGSGPMAKVLVDKLSAHPEYCSKVLGMLAPASPDCEEWPGVPLVGTPDDLEQVAISLGITRVIVSPADVDEHQLEGVLRRCRALALKVSVLPQLSDVLGPAVEIDDVEGVTVLGVNPPWLPRSSRALKRLLDITLAGTLMLLFAPVMAVIAIVIKLDSRGPVLFGQKRVGKAGRLFTVLKFRTMVADAEQRRAELLELSKDPNWLHLDHDPRVTRIGRTLRRLSLDELPQLWNVLRGEMSMVGPRPLIEAEDQRVQAWARGRLDLTPGITGYWQVLGRTRIPFDEMVKLDYLYVMTWSLWGDLRLILRTLPTVVSGRGVN